MNQTPNDAPDGGSEIIVVDDLRVDIGQQRVTRAGIEITLPNLSFELLLALIRVAPNFLSNDMLMARVWPGQVVTPETVAKRVNLLRVALGDNAQEPRYIGGVRSRGYRLVAEVTPEIKSSMPDTATSETKVVSTTPSPKQWLGLGLVAFAVLAVGIVARTTIRTHSASSSMRAEPPQGTDAPVGTRARTVAVMPFENISADASDAYLARGLPEMVLNRLSRVTGLTVIARNSSFALSTTSIDTQEIGRRLNSGYLVNGSVQRKADRLRLTVHLVDTTAGTLIWSATFDRSLNDIFAVEDEIAEQVTGALSARLGGLEPAPPAQARSNNVEAYLAYLRGRTLLGRFTVAESEAAVPYFERTIALDPNFASAYASLYDARMQAADQRREDLTLARKRYRHLIDRALELDPKSGSAYFARAMWGKQPHDASATSGNPLVVARERDFRQGAALDPSNGRGLVAYAGFLYDLERPEEARSVLKRALWLDPMSPFAHFQDGEFSFFDAGVRVAKQKTLQVLELDPNFVPALQRYGQYRWIIDGQLAEAVQIIEHAIALDPKNSDLLYHAMAVYLDLGDTEAARAVVAGMPPGPPEVGLLAMHEGDWRSAGLSAYDEVAWTNDSYNSYSCDFWQGAALRDYAVKTGELSRAIAFIKSKYYFGDAPAEHLDVCNFRDAVYLSQLLAAAGQADQALALRRAASSWNDANEAKYPGDSHRVRAAVLLLDGKQDAALAELAESFHSGFYVHWWYTINYDSLWLPLHGDRRFQAIAADVRRYVDSQRKALEELRRHGDVPDAQRLQESARRPGNK